MVQVKVTAGPKGDSIGLVGVYLDADGNPIEGKEPPPMAMLVALEQAKALMLQGSCLPAEARPRIAMVSPNGGRH